MAATVEIAYKLRDGSNFTGFRGQYAFREGVHIARIDEAKVEKRTRMMALWGADRVNEDGTSEVHTPPAESGNGSEVQVPGDGGSDGAGSASEDSDNGSGAGGAETGTEGSVPSGDGREDAGDDWDTENDNRLLEAVKSLDPKDDDCWTGYGKPTVAAVEKAYGRAGVTRADIERVASGYTRPK